MFHRLLKEKRRPKRGIATASIKNFPPPVLGWNQRDPLPSMDAKHAVVLDNIIPHANRVVSRRGYIKHATGLPSFVESLMSCAQSDTTAAKLFAATPTAIYNVTAQGAVGAAVQTGLTSGRWQHTMFAATGGTVLYMVNGSDTARYTDGTTWTVPAITGTGFASTADFINVCSHQSRLWFVKKASLDAYYLPTASVAGAATKFPLGPLCRLGGELVAIGSWTVDGGSGTNDRLCFVTSQGEVIIYEGTDPASASTWRLAGKFRIPRPIGRRCLVQAGADLGVITVAGVTLLSEILSSGESGQEAAQISDAIAKAWQDSVAYASSHGWQVQEYPDEQLLVVNIPVAERSISYQYVCNLNTGAWCRWKGFQAGCWALHEGKLYFGAHTGFVGRYGPEYTDDGANIAAEYQGAFSDFGEPGTKSFRGARPIMIAPLGYVPTIEARIDYDTSPATIPAGSTALLGATWDVSSWDVGEWGSEPKPTAQWQTIVGEGRALSLIMSISLNQEFILNQVDVLYEKGGLL